MAKKTVMVVDDEEDNRSTVKTALEANGYRVIACENGDECLEKLKKEKPELILMDIMMPGTPVREVVKKIKGPKIAYLSVVRVSDADKENLLGDNVVDFIQKPYDIKTLLKKVADLTTR